MAETNREGLEDELIKEVGEIMGPQVHVFALEYMDPRSIGEEGETLKIEDQYFYAVGDQDENPLYALRFERIRNAISSRLKRGINFPENGRIYYLDK